MIWRVATAIALHNGDDIDKIPESKSQWNAERGYFAERYRDINEPFVGDYIEMAYAAVEAMKEPTKGMEEARIYNSWAGYPEDKGYTAMIDAALKENE